MMITEKGGFNVALINCPECGKQVSSQANVCPQCGYPIKEMTAENGPSVAQIRIVCKTNTIKVDGQTTSHGSIVTVQVKNTREILLSAWGGAVGVLGCSVCKPVTAGHKYDLDVHTTLVGKMLYLKEVNDFV